MKNYIEQMTQLFKKNNFVELSNSRDEVKFLYLYGLYHYYFGDEDCIVEVDEHCKVTYQFENFIQACFEEENYEEKVIDAIAPYYIDENSKFSLDRVKYMLSQITSLIGQLQHNYYSAAGDICILKEYWNTKDKIVIKIITNYKPDYDEKQDLLEVISNIPSYFENVKIAIVFGDDIIDEIAQLTSDKKCVEYGEFILDQPDNFLTYGPEKSIITNITALSLRSNYIKYGKAGLFAMNLRFYVENKKVDQGLEESIKYKGENFWYFNNGIIIVCDDYKIEGNRLLLRNFSIVNGGQTTRMIGVIPFTEDFAISCKIIKNKYKEDRDKNIRFVAEIAEASNTQKPINPTDIIANRPEQRILKADLAEAGIFMQVKRGDAAISNVTENYPLAWQRTKNDELAQIIYAAIYQKPGTARNSKSKIFTDKVKYEMVFGNYSSSKYSPELLKDLLFIRTYYKKWSTMISKSKDADDMKKGLVRNGFYFFLASILLMYKFAVSPRLVSVLKNLGVNSEKGTYILSQRIFSHRIFNDDFDSLQNRMYDLFNLVYDKYISKAYSLLKANSPEIVYSNFTKTDKNYITFVVNYIFDDFAGELSSRVLSVISPIFFRADEILINQANSYVDAYLAKYDSDSEEVQEEQKDLLSEKLYESLKEYRTLVYRRDNIKPYEVFTNKELDRLVMYRPKTKEELYSKMCFLRHPRIKISRYGEDIIDIINSILKVK